MADAVKANEEPERSWRDAAVEHLTALEQQKARAQGFFAQLAAEARKPHYGEMQAGWTRNLLLRAQEAGLFDPTKEHA